MNSIENIKSVVLEYFTAFPDVTAVYLHGSFAKGCSREDSDIDLGLMIISGRRIDKIQMLCISSDLELKLERRVDIGIISSDNLIYSKEAISRGVCIYSSDEFARKMSETTLLSMYLDFQNERKEVLNAYRN